MAQPVETDVNSHPKRPDKRARVLLIRITHVHLPSYLSRAQTGVDNENNRATTSPTNTQANPKTPTLINPNPNINLPVS